MTERLQIYKCEVCGNMVEVVHASSGELVCCGQPMSLLVEGTVDATREKHLPVIARINGGFKVRVGEVAHPMDEKHYVEWIEVIADGEMYRRYLKPGDMPEAAFAIDADNVIALEYCNVHGLWKA